MSQTQIQFQIVQVKTKYNTTEEEIKSFIEKWLQVQGGGED